MRLTLRIILLASSIKFTLSRPLLDVTEHVTSVGFDEFLEVHDRVLVTFSSRTFEPVQAFHQILNNTSENSNTQLVLIDCDIATELCRRYGVNEYPAIRLFKKGGSRQDVETVAIRYRGRKTQRGIESFLKKHELAIATEISPDQLSLFKKVNDVVIVAYVTPTWSEQKDVIYAVAEKHYEGFVFGYTYDEESAKKDGVSIPSIVCYKNADGDHKVLNGQFTEADVENFLETASKLVIGEFSERNVEAYMVPGKLAAYIFAATEDEAIFLRHELTPVAKKFEQYITFGVADALEYGPMAKNLGLAEDKFPALAIHAPMNDNVFTYLQGRKIIASVVDAMLTTILQGKATSGQVFGSEAPEMEGDNAKGETEEHDEL